MNVGSDDLSALFVTLGVSLVLKDTTHAHGTRRDPISAVACILLNNSPASQYAASEPHMDRIIHAIGKVSMRVQDHPRSRL
jgi:hypothetical protein